MDQRRRLTTETPSVIPRHPDPAIWITSAPKARGCIGEWMRMMDVNATRIGTFVFLHDLYIYMEKRKILNDRASAQNWQSVSNDFNIDFQT